MLCHCVRPQSFMNEHPDHRLKPFSSTSSFTKCNQGSFPASPFCQSVFYFAVSCKWITSLAFVARESLSETTSFFSLSYRKAGREKKYPMDRLVCISDPKVLQTINCHYCSFFISGICCVRSGQSSQVCQACLWLMCFVIAPVFWLSVLQYRISAFSFYSRGMVIFWAAVFWL